MKLSFPRIFVTLLALAAPGFAASADFPNQGLEERIQFWTKVYTQYGEDDVIIHDRIRVNLIYDSAARGEDSSKVAAIRRAFDELRANPESPDSLSTTARQLLETLVAKNIPVTADTLTELRDNVHTQLGIKERFRDGVIRSGRYVDSFRQIFEREGVPVEIALLPLVESSFENRARSSAGAGGIWQFTRSTGRLYMTVGKK